ncbi:MAG TPA: polysaccharide pyruvyl transferase family protein [Nitriliruptorales bacterium]|nr:polysaccharide pyruvyl transferase family protein [Nitriliruptorales bacterium]
MTALVQPTGLSETEPRPWPSLCLFGAPEDSGNLGVTALAHATLTGIARTFPGAEVTVFDNGLGASRRSLRVDGASLSYQRCGARLSRRYHRRESLWNMRLSARLGGLANPGSMAILAADAILDVSGGDSFSDLYGPGRLHWVLAPKQLVLDLGRRLVLLPQTYGPFTAPESRAAAAAVVRAADSAWARDARSFLALQDLLGDAFEPARHHEGVDVAFALEPSLPPAPQRDEIGRHHDHPGPLVGLNVSGLLFNDPSSGARFDLRAEYGVLVERLVETFLTRTDARILLVPHVVGPSPESDLQAIAHLRSGLPRRHRERVEVVPPGLGPGEIKWVIAQLDWFCGTRMHAAIASLSSGVATVGLAYSRKTAGVFETCGQGEQVVELRQLTSAQAFERVWSAWLERDSVRPDLLTQAAAVRERAEAQLVEIVRAAAPVGTA